MKKLIYFIIISILFYSCDTNNDREAIRRIVNMTEFTLEMKIFRDDTLYYNIGPWGSLDIKGSCVSGVDDYCTAGWFDAAAYGIIIFNSTHKQEFTEIASSCSEKSIIQPLGDRCNGYNLTKEENVFVYTYQITYEDYRNAELIE